MSVDGPTHKPGPLAKAMCDVAAHIGLGYYSALNGDEWSPDVPGISETEKERRLEQFDADCCNRGIKNWHHEASQLGHDLSFWERFS